MTTFEFSVQDENGLHARPAGLLTKEAMKLKSDITFKKGDKTANAKRLFNVMTLGVKHGDIITCEVSGETEEADAAALKKFIEENI